MRPTDDYLPCLQILVNRLDPLWLPDSPYPRGKISIPHSLILRITHSIPGWATKIKSCPKIEHPPE